MYTESDTVEVKKEYTKDIIKEIIAFLNTKGGKIYIGVTDVGEIVGISNIDQTMNQLSSAIHDSIRPDAKVFIQIAVTKESLICIDVKEGSTKPYYIQGKGLRPEGVYVRLGCASVPSSEAGIKQMLIASTDVNYEGMPCIKQDLSFEAFNQELISNHWKLQVSDYRKLNIIDESDRFTNLGLLVSDSCRHTIKVAVFSEENEFEFLDRREFSGSIFKVLHETLEYLSLNNHLHSRIIDYKRQENHDYWPEIIREGILNAIIHRDYSYSGSIHISIYKNRMEITSLGGLVYGLSFNDIGAGISQTRNPGLANIFYRLKYVEAYGTGIRKIQKAYEMYSMEELIKITDNTFKLILWNTNKQETSIKKTRNNQVKEGKELYQIYSSEEESTIQLFENQGRIRRIEVQNALNIGQTKAGLLLKKLTDQGVVEKEGRGKNTIYRLKK